ncbi:MAG: hypothetical protein J1F40_03945 [Prevotellaceae bacterium]|nr:hypothetical protein [Prevotellaceae bacterium]
MAKKHKEKKVAAVNKSQSIDKTTVSSSISQGLADEEKKQGKSTPIIISVAVTLAMAALSAFHLIVRNSDVLFMAQSKSFFTTNEQFLRECMELPGGMITYIAAFLTQFFYHPWLGASIMIGIWVASLWISKFAFRVKTTWFAVLAIPVICLLVSMIDTGYWIYLMKQEAYWFYGTIGYFIVVVLVLIYSRFRKFTDKLMMTVLIAMSYPSLGWYSLLAMLYTASITLSEYKKEKKFKEKFVQPILAVVLAVVVPPLVCQFYSAIRIEECWTAGFPYFVNDTVHSITPEIPFIIFAIVPLIFPFLPQKECKTWVAYVVTIAVIIFSCIWTEKSDFQNYNYHAEIKMYRAAEEQDWNKVLDEMTGIPGDASRQMVLLKNIALFNDGGVGNKMFRYNNMGATPDNGFDTLHIHMVQTAAPLIYYYHGKTNFASRWCIENNVEFGCDFDNLKMLARCALVGGEMDAARKYLDILKTSIYYKDWAERLMPITKNPKLITKYHEFDSVREMRDHMGSVLDGDNGLVEMYLLNYFSNTMNKDSKLLQEVTLIYAMVQKDINLFWPRFFLYASLHSGEDMPIHYQEAAYLYGQLEPNNVSTKGMPFDQQVIDRYNSFQQVSQSLLKQGMDTAAVGEAMKGAFGDTFYWFYFFCRDIHSY